MKQQDTFLLQKEKQLAKADLSSIGGWDKKIAGLCNKINKSKDYYTTSSCAGRIVLLKYSDVKQEDAFLFRTHDKTDFKELKTALEKMTSIETFYGTGTVSGIKTFGINHAVSYPLPITTIDNGVATFRQWEPAIVP